MATGEQAQASQRGRWRKPVVVAAVCIAAALAGTVASLVMASKALSRAEKSEEALALHRKCMRDLESQLKGLTFATGQKRGLVTSVYLTFPVQPTARCRGVLLEDPEGPDEEEGAEEEGGG